MEILKEFASDPKRMLEMFGQIKTIIPTIKSDFLPVLEKLIRAENLSENQFITFSLLHTFKKKKDAFGAVIIPVETEPTLMGYFWVHEMNRENKDVKIVKELYRVDLFEFVEEKINSIPDLSGLTNLLDSK